jgi:hypothetical protein
MRSSTATNRKITWFVRENEAGSLDLSPAFQRRPVWSPEQSSYLIDTILNNLPFPEIYIRSSTTPDGVTNYEVVDGQQRVRSMLDFAANELQLEGEEISPTLNGITFDELTPSQKTAFWDYDVVTRELHEATDGDIRDLFRRLNISAINLNDQELRHAKYTGEFLKTMEDLADDEWWINHRVVNLRQIRRMEDVEFISELFVAVMAGPQDKKKTLESYYADFDPSFPEKNTWVRRFRDTRTLMTEILSDEEIKGWSGKSDFYTLFHVLSTLLESRWTTKQKQNTANELRLFHTRVAQAKRKDNERKYPTYIHEYADAVSRAATDVARRTTRSNILLDRIEAARQK